ncbi:MAG: prepilin-type N-terminal cleavage/methylation domain-containing protein [Defluviitaleaceae bacterium]|nr:prepilin-type N-terminal cleavage/methylation domain-containing protein [Defluviitaleaceae bacterium]
MKNNGGLTLIELTIVLAIIAIIAAITVPMFLLTTDRARLRGDIQSARVLQNAMELYHAERGRAVAGANGSDAGVVITNLTNANYINPRNVALQTENAVWRLYRGSITVNITTSPDAVRNEAFQSLNAAEKTYVFGGIPATVIPSPSPGP